MPRIGVEFWRWQSKMIEKKLQKMGEKKDFICAAVTEILL
jgi:hypothetical protein